VWVITRSNNRNAIECGSQDDPIPNVHWVYIDLPRWASFWKKGQRGVHLYYFLWQLYAYRVARQLHSQIGFDLVHHVTFAQYQIPSLMGWIPAPFIFGPVGGGESAPASFWPSFSTRGKLFELQRSVGRTLSSWNPLTRAAVRHCDIAIATTKETAQRLGKLGVSRILIQPVFGMTEEDLRYFGMFPTRTTDPFRMISMGRLIHWKGIHLALRAFAAFHRRYPASEYWIAGEGAESKRLRTLARQLGVESHVVFLGNLTLRQTHERLSECDVLAHPALHDNCPVACVEALSAGRPVICVDLGGPAIQVTNETGIKVPAHSPQQVVADLASAMLTLACDPALRIRMGKAAKRRVAEHYHWERRCESMSAIYDELAGYAAGVVEPPHRNLGTRYQENIPS
jgi:glycosyltransferase involved in cell wall biosynthesis